MTEEHVLTKPDTPRENMYLISKTGESSIFTLGVKIGLRCPACNTFNALKPEKVQGLDSKGKTVLGTVKESSPTVPEYNWIITRPEQSKHIKPYCSQKCETAEQL